MEIIQTVTLEDVRNAKPKTIWYAARTCWWTHLPEHLATKPPTPEDIRRTAEIFRLNSSTPDAPLDDFMERARSASRGLPCDPRGSVLPAIIERFTAYSTRVYGTTNANITSDDVRHMFKTRFFFHLDSCVEGDSGSEI